MREFCGLIASELVDFLEKNKENTYRINQIFHWVYERGIVAFKDMTNIPKKLRAFLENQFKLGILQVEKIEESEDNETTKFLWKTSEEEFIESVLIRSGKRRTVCVSSQIGCPARCAFCASGKEGLIRNLTPAEIVEQVLMINSYLLKKDERVTHIVFMGMGEPLENYCFVTKALRILTDPKLFGFSKRKITVSTVGVPHNITRLKDDNIAVNLALSLHAPNQEIRKKIVPYARKFSFESLINTVRNYSNQTKRDITYEYVLISS